MLTQEQVLSAVKAGRKTTCLDGRDYSRLGCFFDKGDLPTLGLKLKEGADWNPDPYTEEEILKQLKSDVSFGIEKAMNERGISSSLMYEVVKMWLWILEDDLQHHSDHHGYGLGFFREVESKYDLASSQA